jgi:hypothetical protein
VYPFVVGVAAIVHLGRRPRDTARSLALVMLVGIVLALRLATLPFAVETAMAAGAGPVLAAIVEIAILLAVGLALVLVSARAVARLRPDQPVSGSPGLGSTGWHTTE